MAGLVVQAVQAELGPTEPWPEDVKFYQPYQVEQILFPDYANCLSVKTFLRMCGLNFHVELRTNAEEMSPSGKVPFIHVGPFLISELDPIIAFVNTKGFQLSRDLSDTEKSELRAYMSLVENILVNLELYLTWVDKNISVEITKPRYGSIHPWPLNLILPWRKQMEMKSKLKSIGWIDKSVDEICEEVRTCCQALSERLDKQDYFFGDRPTELDALVFGHLFTLLTTGLPIDYLTDVIKEFPNLIAFCQRVEDNYYKENDD